MACHLPLFLFFPARGFVQAVRLYRSRSWLDRYYGSETWRN